MPLQLQALTISTDGRRRYGLQGAAGRSQRRRSAGRRGFGARSEGRNLRRGLLALLVGGAALASCLLGGASTAVAAVCPNEAIRLEQGEAALDLPDCRAYEMVTPADKDNGEPKAVVPGLVERNAFEPIEGARAAIAGDRMAWVSEYSLPGLAGAPTPGIDYLSARGSRAWSSEATVPPQSPENGVLCPYLNGMVGWADNLEKGVLSDGDAQEWRSNEEAFYEQTFGCGHDEPRLVEGEPEGFQNLFLRDSNLDSYQLINVTPSTAPRPRPSSDFQPYFPPNYLAGSTGLGTIVFEDELPLSPEAEQLSPEVEAACAEEPKGRGCWEGHDEVYVWSEGREPPVRLVTVLPDGAPVEGALAGSTRNAATGSAGSRPSNVADYRHAVSADGSRIFFEAGGNLYVRENADRPQSALDLGGDCTEAENACTIELDLSEGGGGSGGGSWLGASESGSRAFFTDEAQLTAGSTAAPGAPDLYEYDFEADAGYKLSDLTTDASEPADVLGLSGVSEDGSYVYFVARGVLSGSGQNSSGAVAESGQPNLYAAHEGARRFIATLSEEDLCDWTSDTGCNVSEPGTPRTSGLTARISGNGRYLAFNSLRELTDYANVGEECTELHPQAFATGPCEEIFLYEASGADLACVSCDPDGPPSAQGAAIDWPTPPDTNAEVSGGYPQRNVSEAGQVFFETSEPLVPSQDGNGTRDVYEYEEGTLHLLSNGTSPEPSYFLEADPGGQDVFFTSAQPLLGRDQDGAYDIYDARVGGGFAEPPRPTPPCERECRSPGGPVPAPSPIATSAPNGSGNLAPRRAKSRRRAKQRKAKLGRRLQACVRRHPHDARARARCDRHVRGAPSKRPTAGRLSNGEA